MEPSLGRIRVDRKCGTERFHVNGRPVGFDVLSFWRWAMSDLLSNTTRGVLAEYLVAQALGSAEDVRQPWNPFDVKTRNDVRVEVKSAAYLQSWHQKALSRIVFSTQPTRAWDADTNDLATERTRQADVYVFCLLDHMDKATVDPLNVAQWRFFVITTQRLNAAIGHQKCISLERLLEIGAEETPYDRLCETVDRVSAMH